MQKVGCVRSSLLLMMGIARMEKLWDSGASTLLYGDGDMAVIMLCFLPFHTQSYMCFTHFLVEREKEVR